MTISDMADVALERIESLYAEAEELCQEAAAQADDTARQRLEIEAMSLLQEADQCHETMVELEDSEPDDNPYDPDDD